MTIFETLKQMQLKEQVVVAALYEQGVKDGYAKKERELKEQREKEINDQYDKNVFKEMVGF